MFVTSTKHYMVLNKHHICDMKCFSCFFENIDFQTVQSDSAVFVLKNVIIAVYIDNLLLCESDSHTLD